MKIEKIVKSGLALMLTALLCATAEASLLIGNKTNGVTSTDVTVAVGAEVKLLLYNNSESSSSATYNICIGNNTNTELSYTDSGQYYTASVENRSIKYKSQETRELTIRGLKKTSSAQTLNVYKNSGSSSKVTINITVTGGDTPTPAEVVTFDFDGCQVTATNATKTMVGDEPVLTFTKNGTLNLSCDIVADVLVVGGGGSGAASRSSSSGYQGNGGGGAQSTYKQEETLPSGCYTATVGAGGPNQKAPTDRSVQYVDGTEGGDSVFSNGASLSWTGAGGAAGSGGNKNTSSAGPGGPARLCSITGSDVTYGEGGSAGSKVSTRGNAAAQGDDGKGNGGGGGYGGDTGKGGDGVVIVRLKGVVAPREPITVPTATTAFVYGGTNQTCVAAGEHYVRGGTYEATDAGSYTATVTPESGYCWPDQSYGAKTFNWSIAKRPVTVSVVATNKVEGAEEPIYPTVAEGFVDDDAEVSWKVWRTNLVEQADGSLGLGEEVGTYDLVIAGSASETANYTINYVNGVGAFEIREAIVEIAVPTAATGLVYDGTVQTGVVAGVGYELTGTVTATDAGNYEATATPQSGYRWTGGSTEAQTIPWSIAKANYDMSGVTFANGSTTYNGEVQPLAITGMLPDGVTVAYENNENKDAGNYTVTAKFSGDTKNHNAITDMTATLTIEPASVTVTAKDKTVAFGADAPANEVAYAGLVGGETESVLGGTLAYDCGYDKTTAKVGDKFDIVPKGLTSDNYTLIFKKGTLTVGKATPAAEGDVTLTLTYGETLGEKAASVAGTMKSNGATVTGTYAFAAPETMPAVADTGTGYAATFTPEDTASYNTADVTVQVTVNRKELTVTAKDFTIVYGDEAPTYVTNAVTGFVDGEDAGVLAGEATFSCDYKRGMGTNVYDIVYVTGLTADNYSFACVNGKLTVNQKPVTVTPDAGQSKTQGAAYTITYTSDPATLVGTDDFTGVLSVTDEVGEQFIMQGTLALSDNYKLTVDETVTLLVKAAGPSISEDEGMIDYNPEKKEVVVTPNDGETNIEIINMPSDVTAKVPTSVDTVKGVEPEKIQVIYTPEAAGSRTYDITGAFDVAGDKTSGVTIKLKDDPSATVYVPVGDKVETIKVTPELTEAGDAVVEPLTVQESEVDLGAKTIPGLTYSLKRSTEIGGTSETVDSKCADSVRTKLTDPMKGGKPPQAFYTIEVAK